MEVHRPVGRLVGRDAASKKYDVLTALGAYALSQDKTLQRRVLRLITLITARYNWTHDLLAVGKREIAALWSVDERTVKREMARFRNDLWLVVRRPGTRGRVTEYRLDLDRVLHDTRQQWPAVGPDFALRMEQHETGKGAEIVPLHASGQNHTGVPAGSSNAPDVSSGTEWALAQALMHQDDSAVFASWISGLERVARSGGRLTLRAPSRFHAAYVQTHLEHRLSAACHSVDHTVTEVRVIC